MSDDERLSKLKDRDEWVCWRYEERDGDRTKPPVAPFDGTDYARSDDPETWGSYEEAVRYHEREDTDTEGVGFMLAEEGMVVGVDLDGCRHPETGELEPWAEEIVDRLDTYTEVSPSQTGLRAFVVGLLPDGRNKRKQERTLDVPEWVEEEKNAEVEIYDRTRYMTYTGDHLEGTPTEAKERASTLKEVHAEYVATDSDQADLSGSSDVEEVNLDASEDTDTDGFTNEFGVSLETLRDRDDKLDELLTDLEPSYSLPNDDDSPSGYDMAAASKLWFWRFDEHQIARILRRYRKRAKLDRDDYLENTIGKAKGGERYTPGGGEVDDEDTTAEEARHALEAVVERYESDDEDPSGQARQRIGKLVGLLDEDGHESLRARVADVLDTSPAAVNRHRELMRDKLEDGPILVDDGATYYLSGTPLRKQEILNFELEVDSFLELPGDDSQQVQVGITTEGTRFTKQIEPSVFNKALRFKDEITGQRIGMTFDPSGRSEEQVLDDLNIYLSTRDAPTRTGTHHMGLHGSEIVTPDGSLTADGWTDDPEYVYLSRELGIERAFDLPTDSAVFDADDVARILRDLPRTRDASRLLPVLGWYYAAPFRPHIDEWEGGFNLLNVTGDTGSGKTTTLRYLWRCFGMGGEPFDARDTWFVLLSTYGATNSLPVWHDEYKPSDMTKREVDRFHDALRKTATGQIAQRGNADKSTTEYHLQAPAVVSGEQQIQEPAERRRSIMVKFKTSVTEEGTETRRRFKELVGSGIIEEGELVLPDEAPDPANHALAYYRFVAGMSESEVREAWLDAREKVWNIRESWSTDYTLDDMEIQGLRTVVFGYQIMHEFAGYVGADPADLPSERELEIGLRHVAEAVGPDGERKSHLDKFVELLERAAAAEGYVEEGVDYKFVREGTAEEELRINVSRAYDKLSRYARDHGLDAEDLLDAGAYKDRFATAAEEDGGYVTTYGQNTPPLNRCVGVSTIKAMNALEFDRATFNVEPMDSGLEADSSGDDGGGGGEGPSADKSDETPAAAATDGGQATETAETAGEGNSGPWPEYISVPADEIGAASNAKRIAQYLKESQEGGVMGRSALETTVTLTFDALTPDELEAALEAGERKEGILEVTDSEVRSLL